MRRACDANRCQNFKTKFSCDTKPTMVDSNGRIIFFWKFTSNRLCHWKILYNHVALWMYHRSSSGAHGNCEYDIVSKAKHTSLLKRLKPAAGAAEKCVFLTIQSIRSSRTLLKCLSPMFSLMSLKSDLWSKSELKSDLWTGHPPTPPSYSQFHSKSRGTVKKCSVPSNLLDLSPMPSTSQMWFKCPRKKCRSKGKFPFFRPPPLPHQY